MSHCIKNLLQVFPATHKRRNTVILWANEVFDSTNENRRNDYDFRLWYKDNDCYLDCVHPLSNARWRWRDFVRQTSLPYDTFLLHSVWFQTTTFLSRIRKSQWCSLLYKQLNAVQKGVRNGHTVIMISKTNVMVKHGSTKAKSFWIFQTSASCPLSRFTYAYFHILPT